MWKVFRIVIKGDYERVVVVCGVWHVFVLVDILKYKVIKDNVLFKGIFKKKIKIIWIFWSYN